MRKKRSSMLKLFVSIALAVILCFSLALPTFADEPEEGGFDWAAGTPDSSAPAGLTKILKMPVGTITPSMTFKFVFTPESDNMPEIEPVTITFSSTDDYDTNDGIKTVIKESGDFLGGITWPHAGVYVYTVTETTGDFENTFAETMTFSPAEYDLYVYVKEGINSKNENVYYVYYVGALIITEDAGDGGEEGDKVDPTPGGDPAVTGDYSKMIFTNVYIKNNGGEGPEDPEDPEEIADITVLMVSKTVTGDFADVSKKFNFSVTVTIPELITDWNKPCTAYIVHADGTISENNEFISGEEIVITLKHGEWLAFTDLPVGSSYEVTEAAAEGYTPSYIITSEGGQQVINGSAPEGQELNTSLVYLSDYEEEDEEGEESEKANIVAFLNTFKHITPTGISVDNLPYVVMIAMAILALMGYVLVKSRAGVQANA